MDFFVRIDINIFALILCWLIVHDAYQRTEKQLIQYRLFIGLVFANMALLILELSGVALNGIPGAVPGFLYSAMIVLFYLINPLPPFLWALYIHFQIYSDELKTRRLVVPLILPLIINSVMALSNPFTHKMFYLDSHNHYHRGTMFPLLVIISSFYILYAFALILSNRRQIEKEYYYPLLLFPIPPVIGGIIQVVFPGVTYMWSTMTLSLIIVYNSIQTQKLNTDFLTGIYNRMGFEQYFKNKVHARSKRSFAGIILDIDNFKKINDRYGHAVGDKVLQTTAGLLRKSLRKDDFIARYGGDEFIVIVNAQDKTELERIVKRINNCIYDYNLSSNEPFVLGLSMGYDIFDKTVMDEATFLKHIDSLMYKHKRAKTAAQRKQQFSAELPVNV